MDREMMGQVLDDLIPGDSTEIDEATLGMLFPPGEAAGVIDERTRTVATRFARDHDCQFLFDGQSSKSTFLKLPGRWHELIDNLCTILGKLKRVHRNQKLSQLAKHRSSVSKNFRRRCAKFYAWLRTAIRPLKMFGLRLYTSSITLAFASRTTRDRRTHRSDSATRIKRRGPPHGGELRQAAGTAAPRGRQRRRKKKT
jgi:hypothetical protein